MIGLKLHKLGQMEKAKSLMCWPWSKEHHAQFSLPKSKNCIPHGRNTIMPRFWLAWLVLDFRCLRFKFEDNPSEVIGGFSCPCRSVVQGFDQDDGGHMLFSPQYGLDLSRIKLLLRRDAQSDTQTHGRARRMQETVVIASRMICGRGEW